jgi:hypothetical protein
MEEDAIDIMITRFIIDISARSSKRLGPLKIPISGTPSRIKKARFCSSIRSSTAELQDTTGAQDKLGDGLLYPMG